MSSALDTVLELACDYWAIQGKDMEHPHSLLVRECPPVGRWVWNGRAYRQVRFWGEPDDNNNELCWAGTRGHSDWQSLSAWRRWCGRQAFIMADGWEPGDPNPFDNPAFKDPTRIDSPPNDPTGIEVPEPEEAAQANLEELRRSWYGMRHGRNQLTRAGREEAFRRGNGCVMSMITINVLGTLGSASVRGMMRILPEKRASAEELQEKLYAIISEDGEHLSITILGKTAIERFSEAKSQLLSELTGDPPKLFP